MLEVNIEIIGDKKTIDRIKKFADSLSDWTPELKTTGDFLKQFYSVVIFETEGGAFGSRWAALSPNYEFWKRKSYPGRGILVKTGNMKKAFTYTVQPSYMELRNTADYAKYHQYGTSKMPRRLLVKLDEDRKNKVIDIFKKGVITRIQRAI